MKIPPTFHLFVLLSHVGPNSQISISAMIMVAHQNNDTDKNICNDNQNNLFSTWVTSHMLVTHLMLLQMTNTEKNDVMLLMTV